VNGSFCNLCALAVGLALHTVSSLHSAVLTSPKKGETAVHYCDPTLSVLVMLASRNVFHVVSALQSVVCPHTFSWLIRSLVDPTLAAFLVRGPLQFLVPHLCIFGP